MNVTSVISSAAVAAVVSGLFLVVGTWINGWRQRVFEQRLRGLQFDHERRLARDADLRHLRDVKLDRIRRALMVVIDTATTAQGLARGLVNLGPEMHDPQSTRLDEVLGTLIRQASVVAMDQESNDLADRVRHLLTTAGQYKEQYGMLMRDAATPDAHRVSSKRYEDWLARLQELEAQMLEQAEAIVPAARQVLSDLEKPVPEVAGR